MEDRLKQLKTQYQAISIPDELDDVVAKAISNHKKEPVFRMSLIGVAAAACILTTALNVSPAFAHSVSDLPVVGSIVKVLTFKEYRVEEETVKAAIQVPAVTNLENKELEASLNDKYLEESTKLYNDFMAEMEKLKQNGGGHLGVESGYVVKTDTDRIFALGRYVVNTVGSSSTTFKYDTVDKQNQLLITLPSLFKDDRYISLISENIKEQMRQQMKEDPKKVYWVEGSGSKFTEFKTISPDQNFYINKDGKLVVSFDKYQVAPGYMGVLEFVIPTHVIADALVSSAYIQ